MYEVIHKILNREYSHGSYHSYAGAALAAKAVEQGAIPGSKVTIIKNGEILWELTI